MEITTNLSKRSISNRVRDLEIRNGDKESITRTTEQMEAETRIAGSEQTGNAESLVMQLKEQGEDTIVSMKTFLLKSICQRRRSIKTIAHLSGSNNTSSNLAQNLG